MTSMTDQGFDPAQRPVFGITRWVRGRRRAAAGGAERELRGNMTQPSEYLERNKEVP
jgi:hypothetical protein